MKKKFLCFTFLLLLLMKLPVLAAEYYIEPMEGSAVVTTESLNVRSGPSQDFSRIGALENGETATVKGFVEPDWYVIDYEGEEGYISAQYVSFTTTEEMAAEIRASKGTSPLLVGGLILVILLILVLIGKTISSFLSSKGEEDDDEEEESIPLSPHDDTNMHLGEISYDTFRLDIDPALFETTTIIPQPESIYDSLPSENRTASPAESAPAVTPATPEGTADLQSLDSKLEAASAQIASLQREVEQLKKQNTENGEI